MMFDTPWEYVCYAVMCGFAIHVAIYFMVKGINFLAHFNWWLKR